MQCLCLNHLNLITVRVQEFIDITWSKIDIANCPFMTCYKLTSDLFLTVGEGRYPERWLLLGMLPLVDD